MLTITMDRFEKFLRVFGVKGRAEYERLTKKEQLICQREYLKRLNPIKKKTN